MTRNENMIAGLLRERAGYEARGDGARVALVDEQLAHYGYEPPEAPAGRSTPEQQQANADGEPGETAAAKPRTSSTRKAR